MLSFLIVMVCHSSFLTLGVLWHGNDLIPGIKETLIKLRTSVGHIQHHVISKGKRLIFVTNNSTKSRRQYAEKFRKLGIESVSEEDIFSSSYAAAFYLKNHLGFNENSKRVYVIGQSGITSELDIEGIQWSGSDDDNETIQMGDLSSIQLDATIGAVVIGFDANINYKKLSKAFTFLKYNEGCHFIATSFFRNL